jgi:hypothetical protein
MTIQSTMKLISASTAMTADDAEQAPDVELLLAVAVVGGRAFGLVRS